MIQWFQPRMIFIMHSSIDKIQIPNFKQSLAPVLQKRTIWERGLENYYVRFSTRFVNHLIYCAVISMIDMDIGYSPSTMKNDCIFDVWRQHLSQSISQKKNIIRAWSTNCSYRTKNRFKEADFNQKSQEEKSLNSSESGKENRRMEIGNTTFF